MLKYRTKISEGGRIIIPAICRRQLKLKIGEELIIHIENDELHLLSIKHSLKKAQSLVQKHAKKQSLVSNLKKMRREDADSE